MSTSREFVVSEFQDLVVAAISEVDKRKAIAREKLIEETLDTLREYRLRRSKFDLFHPLYEGISPFGVKYLEPTIEDALEHIKIRIWGFPSDEEGLNTKWQNHHSPLEQLNKLCNAKGSDNLIRVDAGDYRMVTKWLE